MTQTKVDERMVYLAILKSDECQCEKPKKRGMAFCYSCYTQLPNHLKTDLYQRIGNGFEEAYDKALNWLND